MDSMIKEINDNLKTIIDTIKDNLDNSINTLDNIQIQMDKKVEEAKKYKIQVDSAKEKIKTLEDENRSLELSLNELSEKYGKMNLVSLVEAGNREIKTKINDNLKDINKEKEHIAELTNKARTIKDLLINLKKDKTIKEDRLEHLKEIYNYYDARINEIVDYAFDHSNNLSDYKKEVYINYDEDIEEDVKNVELENTMVFDEIANIDDNRNFKDEMTFISSQIDDSLNDDYIEDDEEEKSFDNSYINDTDMNQIFDSIIEDSLEENVENESVNVIDDVDQSSFNIEDYNEDNEEIAADIQEHLEEEKYALSLDDLTKNDDLSEKNDDEIKEFNIDVNPFADEGKDLYKELNINEGVNQVVEDDKEVDIENEERISKINDLFSNFENNTIPIETLEASQSIENKIDDAYKDIFGKTLEEDDLNKKVPTLTDIFGNPVNNDELSNETKVSKKIEELFLENGIDFNKFREDEKNYLKQIYDEEKFNNILNTLKRNKINLDNIYNAFNIFGEITPNELESLISKFVSIGQSVEAIGLILEKLPKVKKYNLDEAIISYGDYVKNIDITELVMKAKELYSNGGNN